MTGKCLVSNEFLCTERRLLATKCPLSLAVHMWAAIWKYIPVQFLIVFCPPTHTSPLAICRVGGWVQNGHSKSMCCISQYHGKINRLVKACSICSNISVDDISVNMFGCWTALCSAAGCSISITFLL